MSKHILKISDNKYETNRFCPICECIDKIYDKIKTQKDIENLETLLVNGYGLVDVLEANNMTSKYKYLQNVPSYHDDIYNKALAQIGNKDTIYNSYNAMSPSLLFGRWCKNCGSRKHDIYDTTFQADFSSKVEFDYDNMILSWNDIHFDFDHSFRISRKDDLGENVILTTTKKHYYHDKLKDGRLYLYQIEVLDELNNPIHIMHKYVLIPSLDHTPQTIPIEYRIHRVLLTPEEAEGKYIPSLPNEYEAINMWESPNQFYWKSEDFNEWGEKLNPSPSEEFKQVSMWENPNSIYWKSEDFNEWGKEIDSSEKSNLIKYDYLYIRYDNSDENLDKVLVKVNDEHVPSKSYWIHDIYFQGNRFDFPDDRTYFAKPYLISKKFKQKDKEDHWYYPHLYFWNENIPAVLIKRENWYKDNIYDLNFIPDDRQMTITFSVKLPHNIKKFHLYFKQGEELIRDHNDTFKHIEFLPKKYIEDYVITINNLASNSKWSFAIFPEYESYDEDIRVEYQSTNFIPPTYELDQYFTKPEDFHDINHWHLAKDFSYYDNYKKVYSCDDRDIVWQCDQLPYHDVGVLLIHDLIVPEFFTLSYDYKFLDKNSDDVFNMFYNFNLEHRIGFIHSKWHSFSKLYENQKQHIIRWEVMRHAHSRQTCAFLDNIHIKAHPIIDTYLDNFTYEEDIKLKDWFYYNKKFRHNGKYRHSPKRYFHMDVNINPYTINDIQD